MSLRWRLLTAGIVLAATIATIAALSRDGEAIPEIPVVVASQRWTAGHPPGDLLIIDMPADRAAFFVHPSELAGVIAAVDVPEGTLVSPQMLRPRQSGDDTRRTTLMRFMVSDEMWPHPGPVPGSRAVFSASPGGCAAALVTLVSVGDGGAAESSVTVEADPELSAVLSDGQWWIWESPPGRWPLCQPSAANGSSAPTSEPEAVR
ncbi:SAF domain-containing protein [Candidatus Poriferisocius sp.]|uniref:SAF domain-containing protein n=1 Tax=Candidatus Poriferisocius sp. TaxID=3101276 RepID=UPI003B0120B2